MRHKSEQTPMQTPTPTAQAHRETPPSAEPQTVTGALADYAHARPLVAHTWAQGPLLIFET